MEGVRIGVTGARKGPELAAALERKGAVAVHGATLMAVPPASDGQLLAETDAILDADPRWLAASTGEGMRAWVEAADAHGRGDRLRELLARTPAVARGPKAVGGLQACGADTQFVSPQQTDADLAVWLRDRVAPGDVVAVQVHGADTGTAYEEVADAGARVLRASAYRTALPEDRQPAWDLVRAAVNGQLDAVVATSAPAANNLVTLAGEIDCEEELVSALRHRVAVAAVGPVTAAAFEAAGVPVDVMPQRSRTGELIRALESWSYRRVEMAGQKAHGPVIELLADGRVARVGNRAVTFGPREFAVLAALVRRPGVACPSELLVREAWGVAAPDDHRQVKHHIARIRRKLGDAGGLIHTVRGVGYRYAPAGDR